MGFVEKDIHELSFNVFDKINKEWMLITAGTQSDCNTMTASWGGLGNFWNNKPVITTYIRPQRYTKEFVDANETFTVSFLGEKYRDARHFLAECQEETIRTRLKMPDLHQSVSVIQPDLMKQI